ncbi:MAG: glycosyltransferase family 2 protein, partial [Candidatus Palauibacterales bacterium]|nr:glycosyltransferase family 2 protein [Candidatus Palauibacterales bacterium]
MTRKSGPRIEDLPPPPEGRTGWPWTEDGDRLPPALPDGSPWPRITVVTPSYQQADFLEETLRSVILQGYPNLEYFVVDGGSRDGSVEIIDRYAPWITRWVSEEDQGQSDAINKGFRWATGSILGWLNSDDTYSPGTLAGVAGAMARSGADIVLGAMDKVQFGGEEPELVKRSLPWEGEAFHPFPILRGGPAPAFHFYQPSMFWTRELWEETGGLDERYHYVMDMEWCNRALAAGATLETVPEVWTRFALHGGSKSQDLTHRQQAERITMY